MEAIIQGLCVILAVPKHTEVGSRKSDAPCRPSGGLYAPGSTDICVQLVRRPLPSGHIGGGGGCGLAERSVHSAIARLLS